MPFSSRPPILHSVAFVLAVVLLIASNPASAAETNAPTTPAASAGSAASAVSATTLPFAAPADALVMRKQMLFDPYAKMDAASVLVPAGWKMKGSTNWIPGDAGGPQIEVVVLNPVQTAGVRMYPNLFFVDGVRENEKRLAMQMDPSGQRWASFEPRFREGQRDTPGVEIRQQPKSPRDYVLNLLLPKLRPSLAADKEMTVVSEMDLPGVDKAKAASSVLPNARFTSSRFRIAYTGPKGPVEEEFICTIRSWPTGQPPRATTMWSANVTSAFALRGKLDALLPTLTAITSSESMQLPYANFVWQIGQMINQRWAEKLRQMGDDENERIRIYGEMQRRASAEVSDRIRANFQRQQEGKALAQEAFMHYIKDTRGYTDPHDGSKLALPANYKFNYISNRGDIIQTDDPTFHPPVDPSTSWNQMEKSR